MAEQISIKRKTGLVMAGVVIGLFATESFLVSSRNIRYGADLIRTEQSSTRIEIEKQERIEKQISPSPDAIVNIRKAEQKKLSEVANESVHNISIHKRFLMPGLQIREISDENKRFLENVNKLERDANERAEKYTF